MFIDLFLYDNYMYRTNELSFPS